MWSGGGGRGEQEVWGERRQAVVCGNGEEGRRSGEKDRRYVERRMEGVCGRGRGRQKVWGRRRTGCGGEDENRMTEERNKREGGEEWT